MVPSGGSTSQRRQVFNEHLQIGLSHSLDRLFRERPALDRFEGSESLDHVLVTPPLGVRLPSKRLLRVPTRFVRRSSRSDIDHLRRHVVGRLAKWAWPHSVSWLWQSSG